MTPTAPQCIDALVVGAGPIGLATAIALKQAGVEVVVIERGRGPYDKACGEGIMPAGIDALRTLGVQLSRRDGWPFAGIRYVDGPYAAAGRFPDGPGWGVRRTVLSKALRQRASALGIALFDGCAWQSLTQKKGYVDVQTAKKQWRATTLIAADGLHSPIRNYLGLGRAAPSRLRRFGVRRHYACAPWSSCVDVHWTAGAEAYVTPVAPDCVGVAFLWGPEPARFETLLCRFPALQAQLAGAVPISAARGAGPLAQPVRCRYAGRVVLVGDAAGYLDALTGEGLTLGFLSAVALAPLVAAGRPLAEYERAYMRLSRPYYREAHWLLALAARPRLRHWAVRLMARFPRLMQGFIAAHSARRLLAPSDFLVAAPPLPPAIAAAASPLPNSRSQRG